MPVRVPSIVAPDIEKLSFPSAMTSINKAASDQMKTPAFLTLLMALAGLALPAMSQTNKSRLSVRPLPTEQEVSNVVQVGVQRDEVIRKFGPPVEHDISPGFVTDTYMEKEPPKRAIAYRHKYSGFVVTYVDDKVDGWDPIYSDLIVSDPHAVLLDSARPGAGATNEIEFNIVEKDPIKNGVYVNTPALPGLGYIKPAPDLVVRKIQSFNLKGPKDNNDPASEFSITVKLATEDAKGLGDLTKQNIARQMLISLNHTPLLAPVLEEPITGGEFQISMSDKKKAEELMQTIKRLVQ